MTGHVAEVAIVQQPPRVLDTRETLRRGASFIAEAASQGARLVVFPESWLSGYPAWVFGAAGWDDALARRLHRRFLEEAVVLGAAGSSDDDLAPMRESAAAHEVTVVVGVNERSGHAGGTVYNSLVTLASDGSIANVHRKLTPTHTERIAWGEGDGAGLRVLDTPVGRVGGLICWEHFHPLARHAMHTQHEQIHVAAWPDMPDIHHVASRMYAAEGRCFVVAAAQYLPVDDVPPELVDLYRAGLGSEQTPSDLLFDGGSTIIGPDGRDVIEPLRGTPGIVYASLPLTARDEMSLDLDVAGHYSRSDVFRLHVDRRRRASASFEDDEVR